jgi:hypothetical protein
LKVDGLAIGHDAALQPAPAVTELPIYSIMPAIESPANWGFPKLRIRPETLLNFFATELPVRITFQVDNSGRVTGLLVYPPRGQKAVPATRLISG